MIIDVILDRQEGAIDYAPETHLRAIYDYATDAGMTDIATAVDSGDEADVKAALMRYITACGYPSALLDYIASVRWTDDATAVAAEKAEAIEDALLAAVKALPFPPDDIFRGTGDGTKEYTALFIL